MPYRVEKARSDSSPPSWQPLDRSRDEVDTAAEASEVLHAPRTPDDVGCHFRVRLVDGEGRTVRVWNYEEWEVD